MTRPKKGATVSRLRREMLETAKDMHASGVMDDATLRKITMRGETRGSPAARPISGDEIRAIRERARMSQAVFAWRLNLTPGYISKVERGAVQPSGPALALFNVIREKGLEVVPG